MPRRATARLPHERYGAELRAETARLAAAAHDADPRLPVPTCPEWTLAQLVGHVGSGMRWAAVIVERRATGPVPNDQADDTAVPAGADDRAAWLLAGADRLARAVREAGPDAPVWTWAAERSAGFWLRRILHDTLIHRADAELAVGSAAGGAVAVAADLAADGVADYLDLCATLSGDHPDPILAALRGDGETLRLHATDEGLGEAGAWLVRRTPGGVVWDRPDTDTDTDSDSGAADATVRGRAADLLLVLNRRVAAGDVPLDVSGDPAVLTDWIERGRL
jgi:uncharacterized protein (TIGR03083 family)